MEQQQFDEQDVGIEQYMDSCQYSIKGVIKYRFSDFIVNEISSSNQIIYAKKDYKHVNKDISRDDQQLDTDEIKEDSKPQFIQLVGQELAENLFRFAEDIYHGDNKGAEPFKIPCPEDKDKRKSIHEWVRNNLRHFISETSNDKATLNLQYKKNTKNVKRFDKKDKQFLQFTLTKTNYDTYSALNIIGKSIRKSMGRFGFCGNKDKRGITSQKITVFECSIDELWRTYNQYLRKAHNQLQISDLEYTQKCLRIGDLYGNRFQLAVRFVDLDDELIQQRVQNIQQNGFINYFGMQRFGSTNIHTHEVGKQIMLRNWKEAVTMLLTSYDQDSKINDIKNEFLLNFNFQESLKLLPMKYKIERSIIEGLKQSNGQNFLQGLMNLPKSNREIYPHAYQSYLWNKVASLRIANLGLHVAVGDLVRESSQKDEITIETENDIEEGAEFNDIKEYEQLDHQTLVKVITTEQEASQYNLQDVLIPIFGSKIEIPLNSNVKQFYEQLLQQDQLTINDFKNSAKEFLLTGGYRNLISKPTDMNFSVVKFDDKNQELLNMYIEEPNYNSKEGKFKAILLNFSLKKSNYATMLLRELTRTSTSFQKQMELNQEIENLINQQQ